MISPAQVLEQVRERIENCDRIQGLLRMASDYVDSANTLYDPIKDRYQVQLPGALVRKIRQLAGHE